ncbi:MAG: proton-conducting transporter membrane subunit [Gammaproteobacteria bacterium]|nr:proton-conducting transporter membrane subunit [Gammaproteobacteria bacterium]
MTEALIGLIFLPLLAGCGAVVGGGRPDRAPAVLGALLGLPALLVPVTLGVWQDGPMFYSLGGWAAPLGIRLLVDPLALVMLWMTAVIGGLAGLHAWHRFPPRSADGMRFWPLWLLLIAAMNALFVSADLFNLYVCLELITLTAIPLIAIAGRPEAIRAAMRYLLLALLASLVWLLGVALIYNATGILDLHLIGERGADSAAFDVGVALLVGALLLKSALFPLHVWLPAAHANAPGAVSAVLSALVVKTGIYLLYRLGFWMLEGDLPTLLAGLFGLLGAGALIHGGVMALIQQRLKLIIAYSTVAQLGYLMLLFPLATAPLAESAAWHGAVYHMLSHGLAKAAMFLAAANILAGLGTDRLSELQRVDQRMPLSLFALALAGVSIMGLPPSGGFVAKWLLLQAAWQASNWWLMAVIVTGSLLAAGYIFRILNASLRRPDPRERIPAAPSPSGSTHPMLASVAMLLALLALLAGFTSVPILGLLDGGGGQ